MEYKFFISTIKELVERRCQGCSRVIVTKVMKNNSVELDGLIVQRKNVRITPTVYLNGYYKQYLDGRSISSIADEIIAINQKERFLPNFEVDSYLDFGYVRNKIALRLINTQQNSILLESVPHRDYMDLSIVYYCYIDTYENGSVATALVHNSHMEQWGVDEELLYSIASANTHRLFPTVIRRMSDILRELVCGDDDESLEQLVGNLEEDEGTDRIMYVATNIRRLYGASAMLDSRAMRNFANRYGDFYIIPSSVHELILIPVDKESDEKRLGEIVKEVNDTQVAYDEILSDSVYLYNSNDNSIRKVNNINSSAD